MFASDLGDLAVEVSDGFAVLPELAQRGAKVAVLPERRRDLVVGFVLTHGRNLQKATRAGHGAAWYGRPTVDQHDAQILKRMAEALHQIRTLLVWSGNLRDPGARGKKPAPLVRLSKQALPCLHGAEEELRGALALLGEEPGWSAEHADAIVLRLQEYASASKFAAPPAVASAEAVARIAELEREVERLQAQEGCERAQEQGVEERLDEAVARIAELEREVGRLQAQEGRELAQEQGVEERLDEAAAVTRSGDPFRELGCFAEFCARCVYAGTVPHPFVKGKTIGPCMRDDPVLPVATWIRSEGRMPPASINEAAALYVQWQREACAAFLERVGVVGGAGRT